MVKPGLVGWLGAGSHVKQSGRVRSIELLPSEAVRLTKEDESIFGNACSEGAEKSTHGDGKIRRGVGAASHQISVESGIGESK